MIFDHVNCPGWHRLFHFQLCISTKILHSDLWTLKLLCTQFTVTFSFLDFVIYPHHILKKNNSCIDINLTFSKVTHSKCIVQRVFVWVVQPFLLSNTNRPQTHNSPAVFPDLPNSYVPGLLTLKFHFHLFPEFWIFFHLTLASALETWHMFLISVLWLLFKHFALQLLTSSPVLVTCGSSPNLFVKNLCMDIHTVHSSQMSISNIFFQFCFLRFICW
jgi:hypothetical protein